MSGCASSNNIRIEYHFEHIEQGYENFTIDSRLMGTWSVEETEQQRRSIRGSPYWFSARIRHDGTKEFIMADLILESDDGVVYSASEVELSHYTPGSNTATGGYFSAFSISGIELIHQPHYVSFILLDNGREHIVEYEFIPYTERSKVSFWRDLEKM